MVVVNKEPTKGQEVAELLRQLTRTYMGMQKHRKKFVSYFKDKLLAGYLSINTDFERFMEKQLQRHLEAFSDTEKKIAKEIEVNAKQHPWYEYLTDIKGVSSKIASGLIGELCGAVYGSIDEGNIKKGSKRPRPELIGYGRVFDNPSSLWAYSGFGVDDEGNGHSRRSGGKECWNHYLKYWLYHFGECQVKAGKKYRKVYEERREYEDKKSPDLSKSHRYARARRYMIKGFLKDIYNDLLKNGEAK
jgi:hypothetical protein